MAGRPVGLRRPAGPAALRPRPGPRPGRRRTGGLRGVRPARPPRHRPARAALPRAPRRPGETARQGLPPGVVLTPTTTDPAVARPGWAGTAAPGSRASSRNAPTSRTGPGCGAGRNSATRLTAEAVVAGVIGPLDAPAGAAARPPRPRTGGCRWSGAPPSSPRPPPPRSARCCSPHRARASVAEAAAAPAGAAPAHRTARLHPVRPDVVVELTVDPAVERPPLAPPRPLRPAPARPAPRRPHPAAPIRTGRSVGNGGSRIATRSATGRALVPRDCCSVPRPRVGAPSGTQQSPSSRSAAKVEGEIGGDRVAARVGVGEHPPVRRHRSALCRVGDRARCRPDVGFGAGDGHGGLPVAGAGGTALASTGGWGPRRGRGKGSALVHPACDRTPDRGPCSPREVRSHRDGSGRVPCLARPTRPCCRFAGPPPATTAPPATPAAAAHATRPRGAAALPIPRASAGGPTIRPAPWTSRHRASPLPGAEPGRPVGDQLVRA